MKWYTVANKLDMVNTKQVIHEYNLRVVNANFLSNIRNILLYSLHIREVMVTTLDIIQKWALVKYSCKNNIGDFSWNGKEWRENKVSKLALLQVKTIRGMSSTVSCCGVRLLKDLFSEHWTVHFTEMNTIMDY